MTAHIFIDNSNIFGGAQRAAETQEPEAIWMAVRVYYRNFFKLIEGEHMVQTRVLAGSVPPGNEELWEHARQYGYDTDLLKRIARDDGRLAEQGVDEMLHLKIANVLLDFDPPQTLVLATGDAGESDFGTSFEQQVRRALKRGWRIEIWSWQDQLSKKFARIAPTTNDVSIKVLDPYYRQITFVREGAYVINSTICQIKGRVVTKL